MTVVVAAHGTRDPAGVAVAHQLVDAMRARLPGRPVVLAFVDVLGPGGDRTDRHPDHVAPAGHGVGEERRAGGVDAGEHLPGRGVVGVRPGAGDHPEADQRERRFGETALTFYRREEGGEPR